MADRSILPSVKHLVLGTALLLACNAPPTAEEYDMTRGGRVDVYFNDPGSRLGNVWDPDVLDVMVDLVESSRVSIDIAVMGFSYEPLVDALIDAWDRGVQIRMVGDAGHINNSGYQAFYERHIPIVPGNAAHIMHDKFLVVDSRFVFAGTANFTDSDLINNSNNFTVMDSPFVAADFTAEFNQMFDGKFGHQKVEIDNGRVYDLGDTTVEVWFSPNEDAMGRILELVDGAQDSIRFTIFAFTKDQVGSAYVRKQAEFLEKDLAEGVDVTADFHDRRSIAGVIDQSQLHSNGQYHEVYRLLNAQVPLRMDGNDSAKQPGDYQAGGGRLHSKTMIIDANGEDPVVISGSFNWSASATQSNDEFLLVFRGERVAQMYDEYFDGLWNGGKRLGTDFLGETVQPGDLSISEVMWYGVTPNDVDGFDEFIEIENHSDHDIQLDMWQIAGVDDTVVGMPPGSTVPAGGKFLIVDHVTEIYTDGAPQDEGSAYVTGDLVINAFNDNRQSRLYLKDEALELFLKDPAAATIDVAGDGGPAFAGGPDGAVARSMERNAGAPDGTLPGSWHASSVTEGGVNVNPDPYELGGETTYREIILATPGEENSP